MSGTTKRIAKNFSWLLLGSLLGGGVSFLTTIYLARRFGVATFGLYRFALAFQAYLIIIVDFGLSLLGMREIAKEKNSAGAIALNILSLKLVISFAVFIISCFILFILPLSIEIKALFVLTFALVFHRALYPDWVYQGLEKMEFIALSWTMSSLGAFFFILFFVKGPGDLLLAPLIQFLSGICASLFFVFILFRFIAPVRLAAFSLGNWSKYFFLAMPLGISILVSQIYHNMDTIMLGFLARPESVGYYTSAYQIFFVLFSLFYLWQATAAPVASHMLHFDKENAKVFLKKYLRLTILFITPTVIVVFLCSPLIITLLFGPKYLPASFALKYLIWALLPMVLGGMSSILILLPAGCFRELLIAVTVGAGVDVVMNLILIPPFGYIGAAIAALMAQSSAAFFAFVYARRVVDIDLFGVAFLPLMISAVAAIATSGAYFAFSFLRLNFGALFTAAVFCAIWSVLTLIFERKFVFDFIKEIVRSR